MDTRNLEEILAHLDAPHPFSEKLQGYLHQCRKNTGFEAVCIAICEVGEFGAEVASSLLSLPHINELGLLGGTALGGAYAVYHTFRHGRKHNALASLYDAVVYAGSTESACVLSATTTEYLAGKLSATPNNPFDPVNLEMRLAALPAAFVLGLTAMSLLTYRKQDEAGQVITLKGLLPQVKTNLSKHLQWKYPITIEKKTLTIAGSEEEIIIRERKLPRTHQKIYVDGAHALYTIHSPLCHYHPEFKEGIREILIEGFTQSNLEVQKTEDVFMHQK